MADSAPWSWPGVCPSIKINLYTGKAPCEVEIDFTVSNFIFLNFKNYYFTEFVVRFLQQNLHIEM